MSVWGGFFCGWGLVLLGWEFVVIDLVSFGDQAVVISWELVVFSFSLIGLG